MKLKPSILGALAAAALLYASPALAAPDTLDSDMKCLAVAAVASGSSSPDTAKGGVAMTLYFLGRVDARAPTLDLESALTTEIKGLTDADLQAEGPRCAAILQARGALLSKVGSDLTGAGGAKPAP